MYQVQLKFNKINKQPNNYNKFNIMIYQIIQINFNNYMIKKYYK